MVLVLVPSICSVLLVTTIPRGTGDYYLHFFFQMVFMVDPVGFCCLSILNVIIGMRQTKSTILLKIRLQQCLPLKQ